jgi:hypothetical protein
MFLQVSYNTNKKSFLFNRFAGVDMSKNKVCATCGTTGKTKVITKGSILIEIVLWLCFLIPGVIYSIWRHTTRVDGCRTCGSNELVPTDSPRGKELIQSYNS